MNYNNLNSLNNDQAESSTYIEPTALNDALSLLDPAIWPQWKESNRQRDIVFEDEEFHNVDLSGLDLSNVNFINCHFNHCQFVATNLISTNLSDSGFVSCDFNQAKLIASILENTAFRKCNLVEVNFLTALFRKTIIVNTDLTHIDLQSIDLRGIVLDGCDLRKQNLAGKDLSHASLKRADLRGADLRRAIFNHANLTSTLLAATILDKCQFKHANLTEVNLSALNLAGANLYSANLTGCNLSGTNLSESNLAKANITDTTLFNINSIGWDISDICCEYAYWDQGATNKTIYAAHEFEKMYAESLTIDLKYEFRLTANEIATLPILIEHLQAHHWGVSLRLKSVKDVAGGALVRLVVDEVGHYSVKELENSLKEEARRIQNAQLAMRADKSMQKELHEAVAGIKDKFWPRLLELATEYEIDQVRNFSVLFIDLKGFTQWSDAIISEKLSLFRGLLKPILAKWNASYPNMEGDSLRATFKSAKAAVECAWMIRHVLMAAEFELRIGIDLGEVTIVHNEVTEQSDLEGTAVSMASRLESMADSGHIYVSEKVKHYAEQQTSLFQFTPVKSQLKKSIGTKMAGDWIEVYDLHKFEPDMSATNRHLQKL
ncbi:MAG: pentapeptide repeat-containing protein [Kangiellaceae bacterium]|nr:pentapeptide repeat-containing protein [Kangiellaceae bacterium]